VRTLRRILDLMGEGFSADGLRTAFLAGVGTLLFFFPFSLLFVAGGLLPHGFAWTASVIIILNGCVTVLSELRHGQAGRTIRDFLVLVAALAGVEWVGVKTGVPFGSYHYTDALPPAVDGIPLAIAFAWYASVANARRLGEAVLGRPSAAWAVALIAGGITLAMDIVLEPMASVVSGYWIWHGEAVPPQNYLSWLVLGTLASLFLLRTRDGRVEPGPVARGRQATAAILLGMQWALFAATNVAHGYLLPSLASAFLLALLWWGFARHRRAGQDTQASAEGS
jgi:putative membrane protein